MYYDCGGIKIRLQDRFCIHRSISLLSLLNLQQQTTLHRIYTRKPAALLVLDVGSEAAIHIALTFYESIKKTPIEDPLYITKKIIVHRLVCHTLL